MKSPEEMKVIQVEITNACTKRCSNCTRFCGHHIKPFYMPFEIFKQAVDSMSGFKGILGIMGGEPTIHPEFTKFIEYFRKSWGNDDQSVACYQPTKDFIGHIVKNVFNINNHNQRGLWTSIGKIYYQNFELIQDTFGYQALNDHSNPSLHETLMVTRKELNIPDEEWIRLRDNCWIQNYWSASITPKGAFFCEVAASLDATLNGPGGWPIEPGWWKRKPSEFDDQLSWCEYCSAALPMPKRDANQGTDDVSPVWMNILKKIGSPKIKSGKVNVFDVGTYDQTSHNIIAESLPYMKDQSQRIDVGQRMLCPKRITVCLHLPENLGIAEVKDIIACNLTKVGIDVIVSKSDQHALIARDQGLPFIDATLQDEENLMDKVKAATGADDWILLLHGFRVGSNLKALLKTYVFNPGCLYVLSDDESTDRVGFEFFNLRAISLNGSIKLLAIDETYPPQKCIALSRDYNKVIKIYVSHHTLTERYTNEVFTPIHVGKALTDDDFGVMGDDSGDNISHLNPIYAELTAQYWAWKNDMESDYIGFNHYRRLFIFNDGFDACVTKAGDRVVVSNMDSSNPSKYGWREADVYEAVKGHNVVVPLPFSVHAEGRLAKNCAEQFIAAHGRKSFEELLNLISEHYPDYLPHAEQFFNGNTMYLCNMFVMQRELFEEYCTWLFGLLDRFSIEKNFYSDYSSNQIRMPAFMAERLFNIWLSHLRDKRPDMKVKEVPYLFVENIAPAPKPIPRIKDSRQIIPIVTAFDENYVPCFSVLLSSIIESSDPAYYYDIIVLADGIADRHRAILDQQVNSSSHIGIRYIDMSAEFQSDEAQSEHFTKPTFFRLQLASLLPDYGKVIYIDPDTIVLRNLIELYDTDVGAKYAGVCLDYTLKELLVSKRRILPEFGEITLEDYWNNRLKLSKIASNAYFNAGVLVLNLNKIRKDRLENRFRKLFWSKKFYLVDQDILNKVFDGSVTYLDPRWNVIPSPINVMKKISYDDFRKYKEAREAPWIIHFAGRHLKPWADKRIDFAELFWLHCRKTPYYETLLAKKIKKDGQIKPDCKIQSSQFSPYKYFAKMSEKSLGTYLSAEVKIDSIARGPMSSVVHRRIGKLLIDCISKNEQPTILIYGAGEHTKYLLGMWPLLFEFVIGFIDRNPKSKFLGLNCHTPEQVKEDMADIILYSSARSEVLMYNNLKKLNLQHILLYESPKNVEQMCPMERPL